MDRLNINDRIKLSGGYDQVPAWLKGGNGYYATVTGFFDNGIEEREGDERLSVSIEFDEELENKGLIGKYGYLLSRWKDNVWTTTGTAHLYLTSIHINKSTDITKENSVWVESHADYTRLI